MGGRKGFYDHFFRRILGSGLLEGRVHEEYYFFLSVRVSKVGYAAVDGLGAWALERVFTTVSSEESLDVVYCFIAISSIQTTLPLGFLIPVYRILTLPLILYIYSTVLLVKF